MISAEEPKQNAQTGHAACILVDGRGLPESLSFNFRRSRKCLRIARVVQAAVVAVVSRTSLSSRESKLEIIIDKLRVQHLLAPIPHSLSLE